ncbi:hypothetical protein [Dactylosporangium sp. CA-139066]|uniref:hypothetical protein n=1 Tax=Dactylosporangium sp. CA-139066 TaxID=3239930 RepID=UPI003D8A9341
MPGVSAVSMFGRLLDRSVAEIGEIAADGRRFDRERIVNVADVWDNNTFPFFAVALTRPRRVAEWRARRALMWMADLGPTRRAWMIEQAGPDLEALLPLPADRPAHYRDYRGQVWPGVAPLDKHAVEEDYDLAAATVRTVRLERAGTSLCAHVALHAPRRFDAAGSLEDAVVQLYLDDVRAAEFDSDDEPGAGITVGAEGFEVRVGRRGRLRAAKATVGFEDMDWYRSTAGRAADAVTPRGRTGPRGPRGVEWRLARGAALDAAHVLHEAMLELRSVRYSTNVGRVPLRELCAAFAGAGAGVLAAAGGARERAFRELAEAWIAASPPAMADRIADRFGEGHWARAAIRADRPAGAAATGTAEVRLVSYTAAHVQWGVPRQASAVLNLAVLLADGTWDMRAQQEQEPGRVTFSADYSSSIQASVSSSK